MLKLSDEKRIWLLAEDIYLKDEGIKGKMHVVRCYSHHFKEGLRIYHAEGHCWEIFKEYVCEPKECQEYPKADNDGHAYTFIEPFDEFKKTGIEVAIEKMSKHMLQKKTFTISIWKRNELKLSKNVTVYSHNELMEEKRRFFEGSPYRPPLSWVTVRRIR